MTFSQQLDIELERSGWLKANNLWDIATDAMLARDWDRFDRLMREINAITKSTRGGRESNKPRPNDQ